LSGTGFQTVSTRKKGEGKLPAISYFQCALLFVDISGFTELSTQLDPENLSKVINSYFQAIVKKVSEFQGDIQKFAGDALFVEWRISPSMSLGQCVEAAASCASSLARDWKLPSYGVPRFGQRRCPTYLPRCALWCWSGRDGGSSHR
jgi:class 3 adenylate cyclase